MSDAVTLQRWQKVARDLADEYRKTSAALVEARLEIDRGKIERARLTHRIEELDEECEALRNQVATLALAAGGGGRL